jgi:sugar lactone lactonase YvrE
VGVFTILLVSAALCASSLHSVLDSFTARERDLSKAVDLTGLCMGESSGGDFADLKIESSFEPSVQFPVKPELFISSFQGAEGITFNGEGWLFIGANNSIWLAEPDGTVRKIADVHRHLGQAGIGRRDILAADFGPTNVFQHGPNDDGIVWRITPEGKKTVVATGIADPNVVLVLPDKTFLVSDDGVDKIYHVKKNKVSIWSTAVAYPNGMALSLDDSVLYVAQIFSNLKPIVPDDRIWAMRIENGTPVGPPTLAFRTGEGGVDGLVLDEFGRVYVADNGAGKIRRFDPRTGETVLVAEGMPGVASLVFGEGKFDRTAIYATSTMRGGGKIWKIPVGARGAKVYR